MFVRLRDFKRLIKEAYTARAYTLRAGEISCFSAAHTGRLQRQKNHWIKRHWQQ